MRISDEDYWADVYRIDLFKHDMYLNSVSEICNVNLGWFISKIERDDNRVHKP